MIKTFKNLLQNRMSDVIETGYHDPRLTFLRKGQIWFLMLLLGKTPLFHAFVGKNA